MKGTSTKRAITIREPARTEQRTRGQQKALQAGEQWFRALLEHSAEVLVVVDGKGEVLYESPSIIRVLGYSLGESIRKRSFPFVHPKDLPRATQVFSYTLAQSEPLPLHEIRVKYLDGSWHTLEFSRINLLTDPAVAGVVISARDITHRKKTEHALQQRTERLDTLHETSSDILSARSLEAMAQIALGYISRFIVCTRASILMFDGEQNAAHVLAVETKSETNIKAGASFRLDVLGGIEHFRQGKLYKVKDLRSLADPTAIEQILEKEGIRSTFGIPLFARDELVGAMYISTSKPHLPEAQEVSIAKEVTNVVAIALQQYRLHEQMRRRAEQLEQEVLARTAELREREKLAATGRMAARIAHEINNPLAGIKNAFRLIKDAVPADHPHAQYVTRIDTEIDRIGNIVQQTFDLYRPEQEASRTFRLDAEIHHVIALLEPSRRQHGVNVFVHDQQPEVVVHLPEGTVRQILFNLLVNAIEASPQGGEVEVRAELNQEKVTIEVSDQGKGIPQEIHAQIFEPFFTTKDGTSRRGLGLGLSISKSLVETMHGRIEFRRRPEQGMTFQVIFPHRIQR